MISAESTIVMIRFFLSMVGPGGAHFFFDLRLVDAISADRRPR